MRVSDFFESISFLIIYVLADLTAIIIGMSETPNCEIARAYILFISSLFLLAAICFGKYYILTEYGIRHKFLGICYRTTTWTEIRDIMRVYNQSGERGRPRVLMVTTNTASQVYRPNETGYIETNKFFCEWLTGKVFMLRSPYPRIADQIVTYVEAHYGTLDYDFFQKTT